MMEIDEIIEKMSPVQKSLVGSAENGFYIIHGRMRSYRKLLSLGLIEKPNRSISAVLTEKGQQVCQHLNGNNV